MRHYQNWRAQSILAWKGKRREGLRATAEITTLGCRRVSRRKASPILSDSIGRGTVSADERINDLPTTAIASLSPKKIFATALALLPIGGGFGRVFPVGAIVMNVHVQGFYDGVTPPAAGITNVGRWTALLVVHFLFPATPVPSLF